MSKYLKLFETTSQYNEYINGSDVVLPNVSVAKDAPKTVYFNPIHDYSEDYLTFVALEDGTFTFSMDQKLTTTAVPSISYSTDNGETWTTVQNIDNEAVTVTTPTITTGNKVLWKSNAVQYYTNPDPYPSPNIGQGSFSSTSTYNVEGNIMSLMYGDDFKGKTSFKTPISSGYEAGAFSGLFKNNHNIISVEHLELPATTLAKYCYYNMFQGCTSLTSAPELPATTLATYCYNTMFDGCTNLTTAPELPATTLAERCYNYIFNGCTKLNYIKAMFTTTPSINYTNNWVSGVAATGTFVKNSTATWNVTGVNGIPSGWTIETASE